MSASCETEEDRTLVLFSYEGLAWIEGPDELLDAFMRCWFCTVLKTERKREKDTQFGSLIN